MDIEMTKIREKHIEEFGNLAETKEKTFDVMQAFALENQAVMR